MNRLWLVLSLVSGLALGGVSEARADSRHLEVVFLPAGEGPTLWVEVASFAEGDRTIRRAQVAWLEGGQAVTRAFDDAAQGAPLLGLYPDAPADVPLEVTADGSLLLTLPAPEGWQERLPPPEPRRASPQKDAPAVAYARSARLLLAAPSAGVPEEGATVSAALYGTERAVEGRARLTRAPAAAGEIVVDAGATLRALELPPQGGGSAFIADVQRACKQTLPRVVLVPGAPAALRLVSEAEVACLGGERAVARLGGVQLSSQGEGAVRGIVVARPRS